MKINRDLIGRIIVLVFALIFLYVGNRLANEGLTLFEYFDNMNTVEARVIEIIDVYVDDDKFWGPLTTVTLPP